jgi:hypothetical protein
VRKTGRGAPLLSFLERSLRIDPPLRLRRLLSDPANGLVLSDLLGVLKSSLLEKVFIQPDAVECIAARSAIAFAESVGGIPCYGYLGDVTESPTGDKKAERFEDGYLEELMEECRRLGFRAVAYMPPRNTLGQLRRLRELCQRLGFMEISGVDVNSPRQSFNCPELLRPEFQHLIESTWALIAHERLTEEDPRLGLFHPESPLVAEPLASRISSYARVGRRLDPSGDRPATEDPLVARWGGI